MLHRVLTRRTHEPRSANAPTKVRKAFPLKNPAVALPRTLKEDSLIKYSNEEFARHASAIYGLPWLQNRRALFFSVYFHLSNSRVFSACVPPGTLCRQKDVAKKRRGEVLRHQAFPLKDIEIGA